ncbi:PKD domain-containing protein [Pedobacter deserti]|uniref:PKD domain-containing protein n=1 Tax=Pedobacter deserti TaxID=2817382 RepID=UPI00210E74DE|nr:PKD domain-containing protein [Pedobacter sp. SYSU D00382]
MNKLLKPLLFLFFAAAIASCSKTDDPGLTFEPEGTMPVVDFDITAGDDPFTWKFTNKTSNFKEVTWRFGDDSVAYDNAPEHVYMTTGKFQVTLTATSESGKTAQVLKEITIDPNKIVGVTAQKTATPNKLAFAAETDPSVQVKALKWTLTDKSRPSPRVSTSESLTPQFDLPAGAISPVEVRLTTNKGSVAVVTKDAGTEGIVTNFMTSLVAYNVSEEGGFNNEKSDRLFDKTTDDKFVLGWSSGKTWNVIMEFAGPEKMIYYSLSNGNDSPGRSPKSWTMEGSNDKATWTLVDSKTMDKHFHQQLVDRGFPNTNAGTRWIKMYFGVDNPGSYKYYRFTITSNFGDGLLQFGNIILFK